MLDASSPLTELILTELQKLTDAISDDVAERSKAKKTLTELRKGLESNDIDALAKLLGKRSEQLVKTFPEARSTLEKLEIDVKRRQDEQARGVFSQLQEYCQAEGIPLHGSPPRFVADYFIEVELDHRANRSRIGIQSIRTLKWSFIREVFDSERARVWQRPFDATSFRDHLVQTYRDLERLKPGTTGWAALDEVYQMLKQRAEKEDPSWKRGGRLVAYYKDEFGADLSKLLEAQASQRIGAPYIELSAIRDPRRAYKVLRPDRNIDEYGFMRPKEM